MEHDRECEFKKLGRQWVNGGWLTEPEIANLRAHGLCFCATRRAGVEVTLEMLVRLGQRWARVRDNYRDKVVQEERAVQASRMSRKEERYFPDSERRVIRVDFRNRKKL